MPNTVRDVKAEHHARVQVGDIYYQTEDRCLTDLWTTNPRHDKIRIEESKGGLLRDSYRWVLENADFQQWRDDPQSRLLWIKGDPGKGKTMLLCGIINELEPTAAIDSTVLSYFFCQATDERLNNAAAVLRGLIFLVVRQQPSLISHIRKEYDHAGEKCLEGPNARVALSQIFTSILRDPALKSAYLIIDALDECTTDLPQLLDLIVQQSSTSSQVKWIVSSRNWLQIEEKLETTWQKVKLSLELNSESVATAVGHYIQHKVSKLSNLKRYDSNTETAVRKYLSSNAHGTFLWVALVCQNLERVQRWNAVAKLNDFPPNLGDLYDRMMDNLNGSGDVDLCRHILAIALSVRRPLALLELSLFVDKLEHDSDSLNALEGIVGLCGSFLILQEGTVYFVHQSARDYLSDKARATIFPFGPGKAHYDIFSRSLRNMSQILRRDIYGLIRLGCPIDKVRPPNPDPLAVIRYSCIHWVDHLCDSDSDSGFMLGRYNDLLDNGSIHTFLENKYLNWLEAVSLIRGMSEGVHAIRKLEAFLREYLQRGQLVDFVHDAHRFILSHNWIIENVPLQVYTSALVFSPARSIVRQCFQTEEPFWITTKPAVEEDWNACLQTLQGHNGAVTSVAISPTGEQVASASSDTIVRLWDMATGECLRTLHGHNDVVNSVAFSTDGQQVASASTDTTIRLWDVATGKCLRTLGIEGRSGVVKSVAFSPSGQQVISASWATIKLWDVVTGECLRTLEGHKYRVNSVAFSPNGQRVASASWATIKLWNVATGKCLQTLKGDNDNVTSAVFSPTGQQVASSSWDNTVRLWDVATGKCLRTLEGHNGNVNSVAFSPNGQQVVSASNDTSVRLWDVATGQCLQTLKGHSNDVTSVVFSPTGQQVASSSWDETVRLWDVATCQWLPDLQGHSSMVTSVVFSPTGQQVASSSWDKTVRLWDAIAGNCLRTLEGHNETVQWVVFSPNGQLVASTSQDYAIRLWNVATGECLHTLEGNGIDVLMAISPNCLQVISSSHKTTRLWTLATGQYQTLEGHSSQINSAAFSPTGQQIASASSNDLCLWNVATGQNQTLEGHSSQINLVAFSPTGGQIASVSSNDLCLWNAVTGQCLRMLEHGNHSIAKSVAFSPTGQQVALAWHHTIELWDVATGQRLESISTNSVVSSLSFDHASRLLTNRGYMDVTLSPSSAPASTSVPADTSFQDAQSPGQRQNTDHPPGPRWSDYALGPDSQWITRNGENVLWLPPEWRLSCSAVSGRTVCTGGKSGRVLIIGFSDA